MNVASLKPRIFQSWTQFWFVPASARPLAGLRIGLGLVLLLQIYMLHDVAFDLLSREGIVQGSLADLLSSTSVPRISGFMNIFSELGWTEGTWISVTTGGFTLSLILMTLGLFTRIATAAAWFLHWTLINSAYSTSYGVDIFAHVFLFYLIWMPSGDVWSIDSQLRQWLSRSFKGIRKKQSASVAARISIRVLQLHLCIMYLSSGIEKALGIQWWNGELMWRALSLPEYQVFDFNWLAQWPHLSQAIGISTLVIEIGYVFFIWPKVTRRFWVLAVIGLHLGIAAFLGLVSFGLAMTVLTATIFGIPSEEVREA